MFCGAFCRRDDLGWSEERRNIARLRLLRTGWRGGKGFSCFSLEGHDDIWPTAEDEEERQFGGLELIAGVEKLRLWRMESGERGCGVEKAGDGREGRVGSRKWFTGVRGVSGLCDCTSRLPSGSNQHVSTPSCELSGRIGKSSLCILIVESL